MELRAVDGIGNEVGKPAGRSGSLTSTTRLRILRTGKKMGYEPRTELRSLFMAIVGIRLGGYQLRSGLFGVTIRGKGWTLGGGTYGRMIVGA